MHAHTYTHIAHTHNFAHYVMCPYYFLATVHNTQTKPHL